MVYAKLTAGIVLGLTAAATSATAQETRKLDFALHAKVERQSNVAQASSSQAGLRGLKLKDTIFTPSATVDYVQPVGRQAIFLRGNVGYAFYDTNDQLNREQLDLTGGVRKTVGPCLVSLTGGYSRGLNRIDDPILIADIENVQEIRRAGIQAACSRATGLGLVGSYSKDWTTNDEARSKFADADREMAMLGVSYSRPALGTITLFGNREETSYTNRLFDDGYDVNSVGISYERKLGARIEGTVMVARSKIEPHAAALPGQGGDFDTTGYSAELTYRASSRLRFRGAFERGVTPASGLGRTYDLREVYQFFADYDLGPRIQFRFGAARADHDTSGGVVLPIVQLTDARTDTVFGTATYKLNKRFSVFVTGGREERTTNAPQFDYTNDRIGVGVDANF